MKNNPSSKDLIENGWVDYNHLIMFADSYKSFKKLYDCYSHFMHSVVVEKSDKLILCNFISNLTCIEFNELIQKRKLGKIKVVNCQTPVITLNEVLDKINETGFESLNIREFSFLDGQKFYTK